MSQNSFSKENLSYSINVFYAMIGCGGERMEKWEKEKEVENVIFHCLVGVRRRRKETGADEVFHLGPPFLLPNWEEKKERKWH